MLKGGINKKNKEYGGKKTNVKWKTYLNADLPTQIYCEDFNTEFNCIPFCSKGNFKQFTVETPNCYYLMTVF